MSSEEAEEDRKETENENDTSFFFSVRCVDTFFRLENYNYQHTK